jgi:hypothetical protein
MRLMVSVQWQREAHDCLVLVLGRNEEIPLQQLLLMMSHHHYLLDLFVLAELYPLTIATHQNPANKPKMIKEKDGLD